MSIINTLKSIKLNVTYLLIVHEDVKTLFNDRSMYQFQINVDIYIHSGVLFVRVEETHFQRSNSELNWYDSIKLERRCKG